MIVAMSSLADKFTMIVVCHLYVISVECSVYNNFYASMTFSLVFCSTLFVQGNFMILSINLIDTPKRC